MGITYKSESDTKYVSTLSGEMKIPAKPGEPGAIERVNKLGKTVHERFIKEIYGYLIGINKHESEEYEPSWIIKLKDPEDDSITQLTIPYSGRLSFGFLGRLPNIDKTKVVVIATGNYNGKPWLTVHQDGKKLDYYWTREEPGHLPNLVKGTYKGKEVYDDTDRMNYLEKYVTTKVVPALKVLYPENEEMVYPEKGDLPPSDTMPTKQEPVAEAETEEEDDLPF